MATVGSIPDKPEWVGATSPPHADLATTIYSHLRAIAQRQVSDEHAGHTLSATALVHEAYMRMAPRGMAPSDEAAFYHAAAQAMRRILIDHARRRGAVKRGANRRCGFDVQSVLDLARDDHLDDALALDEATSRLEMEDAEAFAVIRLRFYAGLTGDKTAELLGISPRQVDRAWAFARAFLRRELQGDRDAGHSE